MSKTIHSRHAGDMPFYSVTISIRRRFHMWREVASVQSDNRLQVADAVALCVEGLPEDTIQISCFLEHRYPLQTKVLKSEHNWFSRFLLAECVNTAFMEMEMEDAR